MRPRVAGRVPARPERPGDRGAVTAEFVILLPALALVLALVVGAVLLSAHRLVLTSAAAELARLEARGDTAVASARLSELGAGVRVERSGRGGVRCVALRSQPLAGLLAAVEVTANGCAAEAGGEEP